MTDLREVTFDDLVEVTNSLRLDLNALQTFALELGDCLNSVSDLVLNHRQEGARADAGVGAAREEAVGELIDSDGQVGPWEGVPLVADVSTIAANHREWEAVGHIPACDASALVRPDRTKKAYQLRK